MELGGTNTWQEELFVRNDRHSSLFVIAFFEERKRLDQGDVWSGKWDQARPLTQKYVTVMHCRRLLLS